MTPAVAIVGLACRYADADSPAELWENVLACRRAFRRLPEVRLRSADYVREDRTGGDCTYAARAAVLDGWRFDRVGRRIAGSTFRSTDLTQWLALDVAGEALEDAGWPGGAGLRRERTAVVVGNTLTSEFARARTLRLRWPYVRRTFAGALAGEGWSPEAAQRLLAEVEERFKAPFAPIDDDALAGSLSNTIAGRICNELDLGGGGYTVDGACAASLLAVTTACGALASGDVDAALAGGVDLSLDPFELVGFAKLGALAHDEMRVYDARPTGFVPGEGCGIVALERLADARARRARVYAVLRGWGVSSDGKGGITRPEVGGQLRAIRRAYARARIGIGSVDLFEGHGTGTDVGDEAELDALTRARREAGCDAPAPIGSIKANIGHTKAAAGAAGLIKATLSVHERVIPPTTGCREPHPLLASSSPGLRVVAAAEPWPHGRPGRAAVSAAGFGGINAHVVLEGGSRRRRLTARQRALARSAQDCELLVFSGRDRAQLRDRLATVAAKVGELSLAEVGDLAAALQRHVDAEPAVRAAVVAATPAQLADGVRRLDAALERDGATSPVIAPGVYLGASARPARVGLLFPGQGSPASGDGGALARRFDWIERIARGPAVAGGGPPTDTAVAQPAIVASSLAGLALLRRVGVHATVAVGHSLGELTALHWGGALSAGALRRVAAARGAAMARSPAGVGAMASVAAGEAAVRSLLEPGIVVAGLNGPRQTVVSGPVAAVEALVRRATERGLTAARLPVSHAFHSPLVAAAAGPLDAALANAGLGPPRRPICSTITGRPLDADADLRALLVAQLTAPVRFEAAMRAALARADVFVEVGPGSVLEGLVRGIADVPVLALDAGGPSLRPTLSVLGLLFATGAATTLQPLYAGRFTRASPLARERAFLANPCEAAPLDGERAAAPTRAIARDAPPPAKPGGDGGVLELVRRLVAARVELPESAVGDDDRLLADLHLTSIAVGELAAAAARAVGAPPPAPPTEIATATVAGLAQAVEAAQAGGGAATPLLPDGVGAWIRAFAPRLEPREPPPGPPPAACRWTVHAPGHPLRDAIAAAFAGGDGEEAVLVCLPPDDDGGRAELLLRAARDVPRCAFLQHGGGAGGFARSLSLERPDMTVCVVDVALDAGLLGDARAEAERASGFAEVRLDADGGRRVPVLRPLKLRPGAARLTARDVLLVSGGGKGIAAEAALGLALESGAAAVLLGRSHPERDPELAASIARFAEAGIRHRYASVDVVDADAVRVAVAAATAELGAVTAILHGAGVNVPARVDDLDAATIEGTLAPKLAGARALLGAVDASKLRAFVTFGSIIGRIGLRGEAHYAHANDRLAALVAGLRPRLADCLCLNVEWSVWTGAGMADRLGTIAALAQQGVSPIPVDEGVRWLSELMRCDDLPPSVVVSGRFGLPPTVDLAPPPLPARRFLERARVHYPGVELVVDAELTRGSDPYLDDHVLDGSTLLPAVLGLEAMANVARALAPAGAARTIRDARFERPVTVPRDGSRTLRAAGLRRRDGTVEVVLRSDETGFQTDHFSAVFTPGDARPPRPGRPLGAADAPLALDPREHLYGSLLFHGPRFQRLRGYRALSARSCVAEIAVADERWFGSFHEQALDLGDPGARDGAIHAIQACIPHERLVPVAVERIDGDGLEPGTAIVRATERSQDGDRYVYDVELLDSAGRVRERWEGLALKRVGPIALPARWAPALLAPYLERRLHALLDDDGAHVALAHGNGTRAASAGAIRDALGDDGDVGRRGDGRPVVAGAAVSASHLNGCTLAIAGSDPVACDIERAAPHPDHVWRDLLGGERFELARCIAAERGEDLDRAAARVWSAAECVKKSGRPVCEPMKLAGAALDDWILLRCGDMRVATVATRMSGIDDDIVVALLHGEARR